MVSNRTLAVFIIATVIVSLAGTLISVSKLGELEAAQKYVAPVRQVTGLASGKVEIAISGTSGCNVDTNVSFGSSGQPATQLNLSTMIDNTGQGFNDCETADCLGVQINNTGNVDLEVNMTCDNNGTSLLGGLNADNSDFQYAIFNGSDIDLYGAAYQEGCRGFPNGTGESAAQWNYMPITTETIICSNLTYENTNDMFTIEFNITIDDQTPAGTKTAILTIDCAQP